MSSNSFSIVATAELVETLTCLDFRLRGRLPSTAFIFNLAARPAVDAEAAAVALETSNADAKSLGNLIQGEGFPDYVYTY